MNLKELVVHRLTICNNCDKKTAVNTCSECGCLLLTKSLIRNSDCPLGKWNTDIQTGMVAPLNGMDKKIDNPTPVETMP